MINVDLNYKRFLCEDYSLNNLFKDSGYDWPGDWEGRALLAFLCHYEINGAEIPHLHRFFNEIPLRVNTDGYFGSIFDGCTADEQQLSGHNWLLRGLLKYHEDFASDAAMSMAKRIVENLYLPTMELYAHYPLERDTEIGDVSGSVTGVRDGWKLSSDIGCAFMCVDGLSHYYRLTRDERVMKMLNNIIEIFLSVDLLKSKLQTHTTLTCLRGILLLYLTTKDEKYLDIVKEKFAFYEKHGMSLTYENFNWFGREDTWTEPCAVVDSFILATELYLITGMDLYRQLARRIWFCGLQFCQRENGGAGPNTCVGDRNKVLKISMYEAPFCCTMRYAEGLLEYSKNKELFTWDKNAALTTDTLGRRFIDDALIVELNGRSLPIFSCNTVPEAEAKSLELIITK